MNKNESEKEREGRKEGRVKGLREAKRKGPMIKVLCE